MVTRIRPPGATVTLTFFPMHLRGTDHSRPAALTSIVGGTRCSRTSPAISSKSLMLPTGRRLSFSFMNRAAGGSPALSLGSALERASMWAMMAIGSASSSKSPS